MKEYHKIDTVFMRNPDDKFKTLLEGEYACDEFRYLANNPWTFTEKVDGTNIRVMIDGGVVRFGGKTDDAQIPAFLVAKLQAKFLTIKELLADSFPDGACLYGEGYGAKIQKGGGLYRQDQDFVLFDVKVGDWWLKREDVSAVALKFGCDVVPVIGAGTLPEMVEMVRGGFRSRWGDFTAEGVVARPAVELKTRAGHRIITKLKYRDFRK